MLVSMTIKARHKGLQARLMPISQGIRVRQKIIWARFMN